MDTVLFRNFPRNLTYRVVDVTLPRDIYNFIFNNTAKYLIFRSNKTFRNLYK